MPFILTLDRATDVLPILAGCACHVQPIRDDGSDWYHMCNSALHDRNEAAGNTNIGSGSQPCHGLSVQSTRVGARTDEGVSVLICHHTAVFKIL